MAAISITASVPIFYDCESSSLTGKIIEVGWAWCNQNEVISESHLIRPDPTWDISDSWDDQAQTLHGISLEQLRSEGEPAYEVARRMNNILAGRELFADSPFDIEWIDQLFTAADLEPTFHVRRMLAPVLIDRLRINRGIAEADARAITDRVKLVHPHTHRAEPDARQWAELWRAMVALAL